jgi:hypothetical protein
MEQDILIYIDDKEKLDASASANSFAHKDVKNRAYINTLGAELAMKYLVSENIDVSDAKNLHSIKKILEENDISDIMLKNIHIDVRVVFDENLIFIPKSHFEYDLTPDIYLVLNLSKDHSFVKFLGFFEPKLINKNNANSQYYFIEKEKLSPTRELVNYIKSHQGNNDKELSDEEYENSERFIVSMVDNDISDSDKKYLIKQLIKNAELRDKFIEYENFETLSYNAMNDSSIKKKEPQIIETTSEINSTMDDTLNLEDFAFDDEFSTDETDEVEENSEASIEEEIQQEETNEISPEISIEDNVLADEVSTDEDFTDNILYDLTIEDEPDTKDTNTSKIDGLGIVEGLGVIGAVGAAGALGATAAEGLALGEAGLVAGQAIAGVGEAIAGAGQIVEGLAELGSITTPEETVSLDSIETTSEEVQQLEEPDTTDTISLDSVEPLEVEENSISETPIEDTISLDDIETLPTDELPTENIPLNDNSMISLDDVSEEIPQEEQLQPEAEALTSIDDIPTDLTETEEIENLEGLEEVVDIDDVDTSINDDEVIDTENFEDIEEAVDIDDVDTSINDDEVIDAENLEDVEEIVEPIEQEIDENIIENLPIENSEVQEDNTESSFGKNLLENLSAESEDAVGIDELIEDETENSQEEDDISSHDLLSQIDDVLNTSATANIETEMVEETDEPQQYDDTESLNEFLEETSDLNVLYNEETSTDEEPTIPIEENVEETEVLPEVPGSALYNKKTVDKKSLIVASALIVVLVLGSALYFLKPKNNTADVEPLPVNNQEPSLPQSTPADDLLASNVPTPQVPVKQDAQATKPVVKELKNTPAKTTKSESYLDVSKLVWDVPDTLSYNSKMQSYLRTAGKSIKLSLSTDLLLATEYAYTNQVKVGLKLSKNGDIQDERILSGSGSTQIDNIVLQSVKDTLNVIKPPSDVISTPDFNLNLIIYF